MEKISPMEVKKVKVLTESKQTNAIVDCIENLGLDIEKIGEGGNADVYAVAGESDFSQLCLKRIKDAPQIQNQDVDREHKFQIMAKKAGVTTPLSLVSFESEKGAHLIMEKINGYSVKDIARDNDLLPDDFDFKKFEFLLSEEMSKLHGAGIVHRDLNSGNVMINFEGKPVIIDFGTACEGNPDSEWVYEETVLLKNPNSGKYEVKSGRYINDKESIKNTIIPMVRKSYFEKQQSLQNLQTNI